MQLLKKPIEFKRFKERYEKVSGLEVPMEYLESSSVYAFKRKGEIIGGFILNHNTPLRSFNVFLTKDKYQIISSKFTKNEYSEVCCFWIDRKYRKKKIVSILSWARMAYEVHRKGKKFVIYGTNSKGLANLYGYPKNSILLESDFVNSLQTFVFIAKTKHFFLGVFEIILSKIFSKKEGGIINSQLNRNTLLNDLSN